MRYCSIQCVIDSRQFFIQKNSYIVRKGDLIDELLFIVRGRLDSMSTNGRRTGFFNIIELNAGHFFGVELLPWALKAPQSFLFQPISTRTVEAITDVEAAPLTAHDLSLCSPTIS